MINTLRTTTPVLIAAGNHTGIMQSILDFDYASGKEKPSLAAIISQGRKSQKFFWGDSEVLIPVFDDIAHPTVRALAPTAFLSLVSASSTAETVRSFFAHFPDAQTAHIFAENVPERDALSLIRDFGEESASPKYIAGPSGVGLLIPHTMKLGAIGGIQGLRVATLGRTAGAVAIVCSSGGMVNELIYQVTEGGAGVSFAVAYGGDRFPITSPFSWILEAERDPQTSHIVYFGELGGEDEYAIVEALHEGRITKPFLCYIAGRYEAKDTTIQFGHAKALAQSRAETATAKSLALREAGAQVSDTFADFMNALAALPQTTHATEHARAWNTRAAHASLTHFSSPLNEEREHGPHSFTEGILLRILNRKSVSKELVSLVDTIFTELIEHGPNVSGAVNTIITTRAGRDMVSALASGILTIGPRFGGAINVAADNWLTGISKNLTPGEFVKQSSKTKTHILGIGHLKYNLYRPDPRVRHLIETFSPHLTEKRHLTFAQDVAALTVRKKQNLILNVDGAVAALMLDFLSEKEGFSEAALRELIEIEFFNALFVIARSTGFIGHYLDQRRIDEGLFRLSDSDILFY